MIVRLGVVALLLLGTMLIFSALAISFIDFLYIFTPKYLFWANRYVGILIISGIPMLLVGIGCVLHERIADDYE